MYWDRDVVPKSIVIQEIYREEQGDVGQPANDRDSSRLEEEGRPGRREVRWPSETCCYEELYEGDEIPYGDHQFRFGA